MSREIECFYPGRGFPSISVTGRACSLDCKHCGRKYLEGMIPATSAAELIDIADALAERGAKGFLLSGGADASGAIPLGSFADAVKEIKQTTDLKVNAHVGLASNEALAHLVKSGIDAFSVDVYGSSETVREVLGLDVGADRYMEVARQLIDLGAPVVAPHICVGIHGGQIVGEMRAVELASELNPAAIVIISLIPTRGTVYGAVRPPGPSDVIPVIARARKLLPEARLLLGCMRSKKDRSWEVDAVHAGVDGIVLPSSGTVSTLKKEGFSVRKRSTCCAVP